MSESKHTSDQLIGCGDHSCLFVRPQGLGTNGGCRCAREPGRLAHNVRVLRRQRDELLEALARRIGPTEPDDTMVICPVCTSQFRAIPLDVQRVRDELLAIAKRYAAECRLCGGHGVRRRPDLDGTPLDDVSCEQCADVRLVIAHAEGRSDE